MGKKFLGNDFLLDTDTAVKLYHKYAKDMPIFDYHCHLQPQEIYENRRFENITQLWLEADHYKWRLMRANGVEEKYITGSGTDWEKFQKWVQTLEKAIGNPLYHWSHMELKKYFGYEGYLHSGNAKEVWDFCSEKIKVEDFTARALIQKSNVKELCTTDDPADSLVWHKKIKEDKNFGVIVLPAWRPEKAMKINNISYIEYIEKLSKTCGIQIASYQKLIRVLTARMDYFEEYGCKISDHSLDYVMYRPASREKTEEIFKRRLEGRELSKEDIKIFETAFMLDMAKEYHRRNWVMQLHYGVQRNVNKKIFDRFGEDAGADCISNDTPSNQLAFFSMRLPERTRFQEQYYIP